MEQWEASAKGVDLAVSAGGGGSDLQEAEDSTSPVRSAKIDTNLTSLYSSKMYVEYLRDKKVPRVPHYLADKKKCTDSR